MCSKPSHSARNQLVDRVVEPPGQLALPLAATPPVDVRSTEVLGRAGAGDGAGDGNEVAGALEDLGFGDEVEIGPRRVGDVGALGDVGHPVKPTGNRAGTQALPSVSQAGCSLRAMDCSSTVSFAHAVRRLGAAARAAGLTVPAFRSPPRRPGAPRTIRRLPGGPVVSVVLRDRAFADVLADMVEGIVIANQLREPAATRVRRTLLDAVTNPEPRRGVSAAA